MKVEGKTEFCESSCILSLLSQLCTETVKRYLLALFFNTATWLVQSVVGSLAVFPTSPKMNALTFMLSSRFLRRTSRNGKEPPSTDTGLLAPWGWLRFLVADQR